MSKLWNYLIGLPLEIQIAGIIDVICCIVMIAGFILIVAGKIEITED